MDPPWRLTLSCDAAVGEACLAAEDCNGLGEGGRCEQGKCGCSPGYHQAKDLLSCRPDAEGTFPSTGTTTVRGPYMLLSQQIK